ncbi:hypothetical protein [Terrimonas pollutisoli]|uniref:hypothetical protein n=1 Tax=Terrimonas pollutisoli TaxID=3034147 RepID=UPI0023EDA137|nr:hypothetical protein [Terrimonas sp. H1YJ31]
MEVKLPVYIIEERPFYVDIDKNQLWEVYQPVNMICFENMHYRDTHYFVTYDLVNSLSPALLLKNPEQREGIQIPQKVELDPIGISKKYNVPLDSLAGRSDFDVIVNHDLLKKRQTGVLPTIDIAGKMYIVDCRLNELRPKDDFSYSIKFDDLYYRVEDEKYLAYYNTASHRIEEIDLNLRSLPKNVVQIEIPGQISLDPVAVARKYELDFKDTLLKHPLHEHRKLKTMPLKDTNLPELVKSNRQRVDLLNKSKDEKDRTKGKGRGI